MCDWQVAYGMPWTDTCGVETDNPSGYCDEHEQYASDQYGVVFTPEECARIDRVRQEEAAHFAD